MGRGAMTGGGIKIVSEQNLGSCYVTLHPTSHTTNTFTPTTLKTIEQMFVNEVEEPESYKNQAGFAPPTLKHKTYINMDSSNWQQGGVTTVVTPSAAPPPSFELLQPTGSSQEDQEKKVNRGGGRKPRDHMEEESLCPEEGEEQACSSEVLVKAEPELHQSTVRHLTHAEAMEDNNQQVTVTTTVRLAQNQKPKRPSSLLVGNGSNSLSSLNIPIETPTNVMNQLD